ncbi:hypothetical protein D3C85_996930 [compost metagenome]
MGILSWWYGDGWRQRVGLIGERLARTLDFFSISLLLQTLFSPFRQISAGKMSGPIGVQVRAFFDRLISRLIGAMVRTFMIVAGIVVITLHVIWGVIVMIGWALVPLLPIAGILLFSIGWAPTWTA